MASRPMAWADTRLVQQAVVAGAADLTDLLLNAPASDTLTVVRIVGDVEIFYVVTNTQADSSSVVDLAIGVTSVDAFAVGEAALPDLTIDARYPPRGWLYVNTQPLTEVITSSTGVQTHHARFKFDVRAMRKVDKGVLFLWIEHNNIDIGGAVDIVGRVRVLCKT